MAGVVVCAWVGRTRVYSRGFRGKHIQICLRLSADRIVLRLGLSQGYGAKGFIVITLLPFVEFPKRRSKPKISFPSFPALRRRGGGRSRAKKMQGNFWVCPRESASAVEAHSAQSGRTKELQATTRSARAISRHQGSIQNTFELCTMNTAKVAFLELPTTMLIRFVASPKDWVREKRIGNGVTRLRRDFGEARDSPTVPQR